MSRTDGAAGAAVAEVAGPAAGHVGADRVLAILIELAGHAEGVTLDEMSRLAGSPKPTVHRALAT